jgi:hypothetical protein
MKVYVNSAKTLLITSSNITTALQNAVPHSLSIIRKHTKLHESDFDKDAAPVIDFTLLCSEKESAFQKGHLTERLFQNEDACAVNVANNQSRFYKPGQEVNGANVYFATGKPDAGWRSRPIVRRLRH